MHAVVVYENRSTWCKISKIATVDNIEAMQFSSLL